jgi:hypothetical protein
MPVRLNSSGGGSVTLDVPATGSTFTATIPANTGTVVTTGSTGVVTQTMMAGSVAGNGPAFAASRSGQSISNSTFTKVILSNEIFDTANAFDTSNGRFTPQVAGYYQFNFTYGSDQTSGALFCEPRKNNVRFEISTITQYISGIGAITSGSSLIYMNGSTDYVELFVYQSSGVSANTTGNTVLSGFLARAA